jgi:hypothetical protein
MIARGGRIAANALTKAGTGVYDLAIAPDLQNFEQCFAEVSIRGEAGEISWVVTAADNVRVETYDSGGQAADRNFAVVVWEPTLAEKVNDWTPV